MATEKNGLTFSKILFLSLVLHSSPNIYAQSTSSLWGIDGEKWVPGKPLLDYSLNGYHSGNDPLPRRPEGSNVRSFGAVGDGITDDTKAFRKAIAACPKGKSVIIPNGRYKLSDSLQIGKDSVSILGEDMFLTQIYFTKGLQELYPKSAKTNDGFPTTTWSWSGGLIWFDGNKETGIDNLTIECPEKQYQGHWQEIGCNALTFVGVAQGWVTNIHFRNIDSGPFIDFESHHVTLRNLLYDEFIGRPESGSSGIGGHHAIDFLQKTNTCLADKLVFKNQFFHELGLEHAAHHNVWSRIKGIDLHFDHHQKNVMHHDLWTDIDAGAGTSIWKNNSKGSSPYEVYWNIRASKKLPFPTNAETQNNIFVGFPGIGTPPGTTNFFEDQGTEPISPANIYFAQLKKRLGVANLPPEVLLNPQPINQIYGVGSNINLTALADDKDGSIAKLELFINDVSMGIKTIEPFTWSQVINEIGTHRIKVLAFDNAGAQSSGTGEIVVGKASNGILKRTAKGPIQFGSRLWLGHEISGKIPEKDGYLIFRINGAVPGNQ